MNSELLSRYDELTTNFDTNKSDTSEIHGNIFSLLGSDANKYIAGTYEALLRKPDLFGSNSINLLYALDVGQTFRKDGLFLLFESFLQKPPTTTESNVLFLWAEYLKKFNKFVTFEPIFEKLNKCLAIWMDKKTFSFKGQEVPLETFRPLMYNSAGINLIDIIPYIAYVFTYHIYGFPLKFSDAYSSSSLKSYLVSLEGWFSAKYLELYDEQNISVLNASMKQNEIDDQTWRDFYTVLLDSKKIVELRNAEINKTSDMLNNMIETQQSVNEVDLYKRFDGVIGRLVDSCIKKSCITTIYNKVPAFDAKYFDANDIANLVSYMVNENDSTHIIDTSNYYKYIHSEESAKYTQITYKKPDYGYNKLTYSFNRPFASADVVTEMFKGYVMKEFKEKKEDILDDDPLWINPSDLTDDIYKFLMPFFVYGCWEYESKEMNVILNNLDKSTLKDLLDMYECLKTIYGMTFGTIITPIYALSLINEFAREHCDLELPFKEFSPIVYLKNRIPDMDRIYKLRDMVTSICYIKNKKFVDFVNRLNADFYDLFKTNTIIVQPYVQGVENDVAVFALGGVETYSYLKYTNPFIRGYGFISTTIGSNEEMDMVKQYASQITNETVLELIEENKTDITTVSNNIVAFTKSKPLTTDRLYAYEFDDACNYKEKAKNHFLDSKDMIEKMLKYAFKQTDASKVLEYEQVRVKVFKMNQKNEIETTPSSVNGFKFGSGFINLKLDAHGSAKRIPVYSIASKIDIRNMAVVNPNGLRCVEFLTPSTGKINENNVFWLFTETPKESKFTKKVKLQKSEIHPNDAQYMLGDRIQSVYKV